MDRTVPKPAARILDLIASKEAGPWRHEVISSHKQHLLPKPLTKMTVKEVLEQGPKWRTKYGSLSSAAGAYQIIHDTLMGLAARLDLKAEQKFDADLQDRLGFDLLRQRGYDLWVKRRISTDSFMLNLAREWASFPVPYDVRGADGKVKRRGQSFYAGDKVGNKALIDVALVWNFLEKLRDESSEADVPSSPSPPINTDPRPDDPVVAFWAKLTTVFLDYIAGKKES